MCNSVVTSTGTAIGDHPRIVWTVRLRKGASKYKDPPRKSKREENSEITKERVGVRVNY